MRFRPDRLLPLAAAVALAAAALATALPSEPARAKRHREPEVVSLWPEGAPGAKGTQDKDIPTLTVHPPARATANGTAVLVFPGGGYRGLTMISEGHAVGEWLATLGVTAFVVRYRLPGDGYPHPVPLQDAERALATVRHEAARWSVAPDRIGAMGFSAGGHLVSTLATHFSEHRPSPVDAIDETQSRPDFAILAYPVITMGPYTHPGSRSQLIGDPPDPGLVQLLSNELHVTARTPPTFLVHAADDRAAPPDNSLLFYRALRHAGVPSELHIFERGGHGLREGRGWGFGGKRVGPASAWPDRVADWLRARGLLSGSATGLAPATAE